MDEARSATTNPAPLPWATDLKSLIAEAAALDDAAGCLFVIEPGIPEAARRGYAALVLAHTRHGEPVSIFDDGSALLLVTHGGVDSGRVAAKRILDQMEILGLETTLRVAVAAVDAQPDTLTQRLRGLAESGKPGTVAS